MRDNILTFRIIYLVTALVESHPPPATNGHPSNPYDVKMVYILEKAYA